MAKKSRWAKAAATSKPGEGSRFKALSADVQASGKSKKASNAIAAAIGRAKYGKAKFAAMSRKGKSY